MIISLHDRIEGVPTSKGSAGLNATADALESDRLRNMPAGLRVRRIEQTPRLAQLAASKPRCGMFLCTSCRMPFGRYNPTQRLCAKCQAQRRAHRQQVVRH